MLREAELFEMAEPVLVEVLGRIRPEDRAIVLPPLFDLPGIGAPCAIGPVVDLFAYDDDCVPAVLAGTWTGDGAGDGDREPGAAGRALLGDDASAALTRIAGAAVAAAREVRAGHAVLHSRYGELSARDLLLRLTLTRALLAHYVAAYLGSTACPLPEELARPLWELTRNDAARWRALGTFRDPLPVPAQASWRDTFLLTAGHVPHPLGH